MLNYIKNEFKKDKILFTNDIFCFCTAIISSLYMSLTIPNTNFKILYIIYILNALSSIICAINKESLGLISTNIFYLFVDIIGLLRLLRLLK